MKSRVSLTILIVLCQIGCHHQNQSAGVSASQPPAAQADIQHSDVLNRLPVPVAAAFQKSHPHISPTRLHIRLFPDGTTHYQVIYVDNNGQLQQAEYYPDGRSVP